MREYLCIFAKIAQATLPCPGGSDLAVSMIRSNHNPVDRPRRPASRVVGRYMARWSIAVALMIALSHSASAERKPLPHDEVLYCSAVFEARAEWLLRWQGDRHAIANAFRRAEFLLTAYDVKMDQYHIDPGIMGGGRSLSALITHSLERNALVSNVMRSYAETGMADGFPPSCMEDALCTVCTDLLRVVRYE
jgi:hypothetical protein